MRLASRVIAITGASAGIGRATAELAAAEGATVVLSARRLEKLASVAQTIEAKGGRVLAIPGDVAREADMQALVDRTVETFGGLDVMICNAGIGYHDRFEDTPLDVARKLVDINLMGTFHAAQPAVRVFRRQNRGHLIAVSSVVGRRGVGGSAVYAATKAAQVGFVESLRAEFTGTPLKASVVFPISTRTEFHDTIRRESAARSARRAHARTPIRSRGRSSSASSTRARRSTRTGPPSCWPC
jgi:short-subunit dehydrogenase